MVTLERLKELLIYNPATGAFTWRVKPCDRIAAGAVASNINKRHGYVRIGIDWKRYMAHRLAWFYMTGEWPADEIDHKNGIRSDNKWTNLREATTKINRQNLHWPRRRNKVGLLGVSPNTNGRGEKPFSAFIKYDGKVHNLGNYRTAQEAHTAYLEAKREHHEGCTI